MEVHEQNEGNKDAVTKILKRRIKNCGTQEIFV